MKRSHFSDDEWLGIRRNYKLSGTLAQLDRLRLSLIKHYLSDSAEAIATHVCGLLLLKAFSNLAVVLTATLIKCYIYIYIYKHKKATQNL